jgi:hypothetical protein
MMNEDKIGKMLNELGRRSEEPVRPTLSDDIKAHIPSQIVHHRRGMHTVNIIIDLRVGRIAAAAAVLITLVLLAGLLGSRSSSDGGFLQETKVLVGYFLKSGDEDTLETAESMRDFLVGKGEEDVVVYGNLPERPDSNSILMHWKVSDDKYQIVFNDFRVKKVSAEELIEMQAEMLQRR